MYGSSCFCACSGSVLLGLVMPQGCNLGGTTSVHRVGDSGLHVRVVTSARRRPYLRGGPQTDVRQPCPEFPTSPLTGNHIQHFLQAAVDRFLIFLGHSTIVFLLAHSSVGVKALADQVKNDSTEFRSVTGVVGASVKSQALDSGCELGFDTAPKLACSCVGAGNPVDAPRRPPGPIGRPATLAR